MAARLLAVGDDVDARVLLVAQHEPHRIALAFGERVAFELPRRPQLPRARRATKASAGCRRSWFARAYGHCVGFRASGIECAILSARSIATRLRFDAPHRSGRLTTRPRCRVPCAVRRRRRVALHHDSPMPRSCSPTTNSPTSSSSAKSSLARASSSKLAQCKTEDEVIDSGARLRRHPAAIRADHRSASSRRCRNSASSAGSAPASTRSTPKPAGRTASGSPIRPTTASARWRRTRWRWRSRRCATSSRYHATSAAAHWHYLSSGTLRAAAELTLGIVGLGRIGKRMAHVSRNVFKRVVACDPYLIDGDFPAYVERAPSLEALAATGGRRVAAHAARRDDARHDRRRDSSRAAKPG